jgi:hypothetical protein
MRKDDLYPSKYLKAADVGDREMRLTISHVEVEELGPDDKKEKKLVVYFERAAKGLVTNVTNWDRLDYAFGDTDNWPGQKITLYAEPVKVKGESKLGLRVRAVKAPAATVNVATGMDDEIPF